MDARALERFQRRRPRLAADRGRSVAGLAPVELSSGASSQARRRSSTVDAVEPVLLNWRYTIEAGPILIVSRSSRRQGLPSFFPPRNVPFLLPRSSSLAPFSSTVIRACRRETEASSIQTTESC